MRRSRFGSPWVVAVLTAGFAPACKSVGAEGGPICPGCVAGGESSDFSGGSVPATEDLCEAYLVVSEPLDDGDDGDDARLVHDVRRRLTTATSAPFQWSVPEKVESGAPATGYEPGTISVETKFTFGETFVEYLDPAECADGYCFHQGELIRCALRDERWLRQDFEVRLKTSDHAIDATLAGSGRITKDGHFATGRYVNGGQPRAYASEVDGTLRIAPSEPGDPRIWADLALFDSELRGNVMIRLETWNDTSDSYFPPYIPLVGSWPTGDLCTTDADTPNVLLGGKTPRELLVEVKTGTQGTQNASWDDGRPEVVQVSYDESVGAGVCLGRQSVTFPEQRVSMRIADTEVDVSWKGLTILHEAGEIAGFGSEARFKYDAEETRIGEELVSYDTPHEDALTVDVFLSDAKATFDSGYGTWTGTAFPAWDVQVSQVAWKGCSEEGCGSMEQVACLGTNEHGYNPCNALLTDWPVVPVDVTETVTRIFESPSSVPVTPTPDATRFDSGSPEPVTASVMHSDAGVSAEPAPASVIRSDAGASTRADAF